jgi:hypothetical protein
MTNTETDTTEIAVPENAVLAIAAADAEVVVGVHDPMYLNLGADAIRHAHSTVGYFDGPAAEWSDSLQDLESVLAEAYTHRSTEENHLFRVHPHDVWLTTAALALFRTEPLAEIYTEAYAADAKAAAGAWREAYDSIQAADPRRLPSKEAARAAIRDAVVTTTDDLKEQYRDAYDE